MGDLVIRKFTLALMMDEGARYEVTVEWKRNPGIKRTHVE
jgi:hypothetical protein